MVQLHFFTGIVENRFWPKIGLVPFKIRCPCLEIKTVDCPLIALHSGSRMKTGTRGSRKSWLKQLYVHKGLNLCYTDTYNLFICLCMTHYTSIRSPGLCTCIFGAAKVHIQLLSAGTTHLGDIVEALFPLSHL